MLLYENIDDQYQQLSMYVKVNENYPIVHKCINRYYCSASSSNEYGSFVRNLHSYRLFYGYASTYKA